MKRQRERERERETEDNGDENENQSRNQGKWVNGARLRPCRRASVVPYRCKAITPVGGAGISAHLPPKSPHYMPTDSICQHYHSRTGDILNAREKKNDRPVPRLHVDNFFNQKKKIYIHQKKVKPRFHIVCPIPLLTPFAIQFANYRDPPITALAGDDYRF